MADQLPPEPPLTQTHPFVDDAGMIDREWYFWLLKHVEYIKTLEDRVRALEPP